MPDTTYHFDIIALIALFTSIVALLWNIIRDLLLDKVKVSLEASAGGLIPVKGMPSKFWFRDADSEYSPTNPQICFTVTNVGRRPILISKIWGKFSKEAQSSGGKHPLFIVNTVDLPKKIEPYEKLTEICYDTDFMVALKNNQVTHLYAQDSKGKDWQISKKRMNRLPETIGRVTL